MANPPVTPPDEDPTKDTLRKLKSRMQGYKEPMPAPLSAAPPASADTPTNPPAAAETAEITSDAAGAEPPAPEPAEVPGALSTDLLERFAMVEDLEAERYRSKPWRQLPGESPLEYAIFMEYLTPPLAQGREIDSLHTRLNAHELQEWFSQLAALLPMPAYVVNGHGKPAPAEDETEKTGKAGKAGKTGKGGKSDDDKPATSLAAAPPTPDAETRALWWLAKRNLWHERGRLYDAWQMSVLAHERRLQIQTFARDLHRQYVDHAVELTAILKSIRSGIKDAVIKSGGRLQKMKETRNIMPTEERRDANGKITHAATPYIVMDMEWDPMAQIEVMHRLTDRLFGPLPNMLDGDMTTVLDQSFGLPPEVSPDGKLSANGLSKDVPPGKRGNSGWLMERLGKVQADMDSRKQLTAPGGARRGQPPKAD